MLADSSGGALKLVLLLGEHWQENKRVMSP